MGKQVRIHRCAKDKDNPYKAVSRAPFDGSGLSFEARGVLAYALMKPDDWELNVPDLMREGGIGRDKAFGIIKELIAAGYSGRVEGRDKAGKFGGNDIHIYESPNLAPNQQSTPDPHPEKPDTANPDTDIPHTEKPDTVSPDTENQEQTNKGKELNSEVTKKGRESIPPARIAITIAAFKGERCQAQNFIALPRPPAFREWVRATGQRRKCGRGLLRAVQHLRR